MPINSSKLVIGIICIDLMVSRITCKQTSRILPFFMIMLKIFDINNVIKASEKVFEFAQFTVFDLIN